MDMKNKIVIGLCCVVSIASAQEVVTLGTFGYVKNALTNTYHISGMQFDNAPSNTPTIVYGDSLPLNSVIHVWGGSGYISSTYKSVFVPGSGFVVKWTSDPELGNGEGYWVAVPGSTNATLSGDVPMDDVITNSIVAGFQICSYPYPVDRVITNLGFIPSINDVIHVWNGSTYVSSTYKSVFVPGSGFVIKWTDETIPVATGAGFWYDSAANVNWIVERPY